MTNHNYSKSHNNDPCRPEKNTVKNMSNCDCDITIKNKEESSVLITLLAINACMFVIEISLGIYSESTALIADSLDMLADATVYGNGLYAI